MPRGTVVQVLTSGDFGGGQMVGLIVARQLARLGFSIRFASPTSGAFTKLARTVGELDIVPGTSLRDVAALVRITRYLRHVRPALIHTHTPIAASILWRLAARRASIPVVHHVHASNFYGRLPNSLVATAIDRLTAAYPRRYIAVSETTTSSVLADGYPPSRVETIRNPISWHQQERRAAVHTTAPIIACVGRLSPMKGQANLIDAFERIRGEHPAAKLWIIGSADEPNSAFARSLVMLAADSGLAEAITFWGDQTDVEAFVRQADVLVLPSLDEALPLVLLDAMSAGVPVIATSVGGVPELVEDRRTGLVVEPGNVAELANALRTVLRDPAYRDDLSLAAYDFVWETFSNERTLDRIVSIIDKEAGSANRD